MKQKLIFSATASPETRILRNINSKYFKVNDKLKRIVKKDLHYLTLCFVRYCRKKGSMNVLWEHLHWPSGFFLFFYFIFTKGGWEVANIQTKSNFTSQIDFTFKSDECKRPTVPYYKRRASMTLSMVEFPEMHWFGPFLILW